MRKAIQAETETRFLRLCPLAMTGLTLLVAFQIGSRAARADTSGSISSRVRVVCLGERHLVYGPRSSCGVHLKSKELRLQVPSLPGGPCTGPGWLKVSVSSNAYGRRVHTFTNVGPYPVFLYLASVRASGNFAPRGYALELTLLKGAESRELSEPPYQGFAYRYTYLNAAYLNFGSGVFTPCSDSVRASIVRQLPEVCRAASAAASCFDQAHDQIKREAQRRGR
jgi:hypothetical protein